MTPEKEEEIIEKEDIVEEEVSKPVEPRVIRAILPPETPPKQAESDTESILEPFVTVSPHHQKPPEEHRFTMELESITSTNCTIYVYI